MRVEDMGKKQLKFPKRKKSLTPAGTVFTTPMPPPLQKSLK